MLDRDLFWKLAEVEHPKAVRFCRNLAGNAADGDDLYQDAILAAWRKFDSLRDIESFRAWLYRIIVNLYRGRCRRRSIIAFLSLEPSISDKLMADDEMAKITTRRWLNRALGTLKPEDKALIILFELDGWSIAELARIYRKPEGTIKSRLARARQKMRAVLAGYISRGKKNDLKIEAEYVLPRSEISPE